MYPTKKLWEICEIITWNTPRTSNSGFFWWNVLWAWPADIWEEKYIFKTKKTLTEKWLLDGKARLVKKWSVLLVAIGTIWKASIAWCDLTTNQQIHALQVNKDIISEFLYYSFLNSKKELRNQSSNAVLAILNKTKLSNLFIPLPPLPTQQKIVSKLDSSFEKLDQTITLTKQNLANIEELNKSALEKIFKECEGKYEKRKIQDFSEVKSWKRLPKWEKVESSNTWYPYIRVTDFLDTWTINLNTVMYISEKNFNTICNYIITKDDLYISIAWTIWKTWIIPEELNWANLTENAVRLVYNDKDKIFNKYIYYFTLSENFKNQAWLATRAVAMPKLAISRLKQISIPLPPLPEQQKIVEYLDNIFAKNKILQEKYKQDLKNFEELKQSILKQAFEDKDFIK